MITGDHRETAQQIAREIGLQEAGAPMTGAELAQLEIGRAHV